MLHNPIRYLSLLLVVIIATPILGQESLEQAWEYAISASKKLEAEGYKINSAQATKDAASAARMPQFAMESSYTTMSSSPKMKVDMTPAMQGFAYAAAMSNLPELAGSILALPTQMETPVSNQSFGTASVGVIVPIYTGGKISSLESAGQSLTQAAIYSRTAETSNLKLEVAQAYLMVQRVEKLHQVAVAAKESLDGHLKDVQNLLEQGLVTKTALLSAQVAQAQAQQNVLNVEFGLKTAKAAYNRLLWRPLDSPVSLVELPMPNDIQTVETLMNMAVQIRPELSQLAAQSQALNSKADSIRAERRPQVAAGASFSYYENDHLSTNGYGQGTVGVVWSPIDSVGRARERATRNEAYAVCKMRDEVANAIRLQVQKAYNDNQVARNRINIAQLAVQQSEENLRLVKEQFKQGIATYTQVLDAQALWNQAHSNYCNSIYDALLASYTLKHAVGNL